MTKRGRTLQERTLHYFFGSCCLCCLIDLGFMLSLLCLCFSMYLVLYSLKTSVMVESFAIYYGVYYEIVLPLLEDDGMDGWWICFCISCCLTLIFLYAIMYDIYLDWLMHHFKGSLFINSSIYEFCHHQKGEDCWPKGTIVLRFDADPLMNIYRN